MTRGISLIETVVSIVVVSVMLSAALSAAGLARTQGVIVAEREQAALLAAQLMAEIQAQSYEDPDGSPTLGIETADTSGTTRAHFDDIDDYDRWSSSPPEHPDGTPVAGASGFTREARVVPVNSADILNVLASESGIKRITVRVSVRGRLAAELVGYRTAEGVPAAFGSSP